MDCSNLNWAANVSRWKYVLTSCVSFRSLSGIDFGHFQAYDKKTGAMLLQGSGSLLLVYGGYSWDGCTGIGKAYEDEKTLMASLLHDALYQVGKQKGYDAAFSLREADKEFLWQMKALGVPWLVRNLWWAGVATIGTLWKFNTLDQLKIVSIPAER